MTKLRATTQLGLVLAGTVMGALLTPACSAVWGSCECPVPRPIVQGEFASGALDVAGTPPPEFERMVPGKLLIQADAIVLQYELDGQAGSARFAIANKYDL